MRETPLPVGPKIGGIRTGCRGIDWEQGVILCFLLRY